MNTQERVRYNNKIESTRVKLINYYLSKVWKVVKPVEKVA